MELERKLKSALKFIASREFFVLCEKKITSICFHSTHVSFIFFSLHSHTHTHNSLSINRNYQRNHRRYSQKRLILRLIMMRSSSHIFYHDFIIGWSICERQFLVKTRDLIYQIHMGRLDSVFAFYSGRLPCDECFFGRFFCLF